MVAILTASVAATCITYVMAHQRATTSAAAAPRAVPAQQLVAQVAAVPSSMDPPPGVPARDIGTLDVAHDDKTTQKEHVARPRAQAGVDARPATSQGSGNAELVVQEKAAPSESGQEHLGDAMRNAVGDHERAGESATHEPSGPGASQVRPSPGAVVGALGSVLPGARACLGPDDPIRNGLVVFRSDGTVARVDLQGAKRTTDDCVKTALSNAKVSPFLDESFATRVTVRP